MSSLIWFTMCPCKRSTLGKSRCNWWRWDESVWSCCAISFLWLDEGLWHRQKESVFSGHCKVLQLSEGWSRPCACRCWGDWRWLFADVVRFSCSIIFSLWKWQVKKKSSGCIAWRKTLRSQARNSYASAEVATFLLNESPAESLLILDVGSEGHRGITEEAAEQKKEIIRPSREIDERLRRSYSQDGGSYLYFSVLFLCRSMISCIHCSLWK